MKSWSFKVTTIAGTEVRIHATFLLLILFAGWSGAMEGGLVMALDMMLFLCSMFLCVLLHEFGHVTAARRYGIHTPNITLLPIGGIARLERMPRKPSEELVVAICGPLVNVVIATLIFITTTRDLSSLNLKLDILHGHLLQRLMVWNLWMVAFNMIPAFPMDGGRVLRAALALFVDYGAATRSAAAIGQAIAVLGFVVTLFWLHNPLLLIIALFIFMSAGQEAALVTEEEATSGLRVSDAMVTELHTLRDDATLREAVDLMISGTQHDFPVVDDRGRLVGLLSRTALISGLAAHGIECPVSSVMEDCDATLTPQLLLSRGMEQLRNSACPVLPVLDASSGRVIGLLTSENIGEVLMVREALKAAKPC